MTVMLGIADASARTGLSKDTLRWYENEGLIPAVARGSDGRRRYDEPTLRLIELLVRLRRTGMLVLGLDCAEEPMGPALIGEQRRTQ